MQSKKINFLLSLISLCWVVIISNVSLAAGLPKLVQLAPPVNKTHDLIKKVYAVALANLDTQFVLAKDGTVYVSTGDIKAEWLRDSSVQVRPFLFFARDNQEVANLVKGVVIRQARYMSLDPYANAFYENYTIHERKFELDSLANPIILAWTYWKVTGDSSIFTDDVKKGFQAAVNTMLIEQDHPKKSKYTHKYLKGNPVAYTGMIWSGYRPSDDACVYNFLIPAQAMAAQALQAYAEISTQVWQDTAAADVANKLKSEVLAGIEKYGLVKTPEGKKIYAYEVDGLGNHLLMDDANLPSLLSLPYYGFVAGDDPVYLATRERILSPLNPYFYSGKYLTGIGSPHTPKDMVWPLGLIAQAFTSPNKEDLFAAMTSLFASYNGGISLNESVDINNPKRFTRADFGWPNAMYVEFALTKWNGLPSLPKVQIK